MLHTEPTKATARISLSKVGFPPLLRVTQMWRQWVLLDSSSRRIEEIHVRPPISTSDKGDKIWQWKPTPVPFLPPGPTPPTQFYPLPPPPSLLPPVPTGHRWPALLEHRLALLPILRQSAKWCSLSAGFLYSPGAINMLAFNTWSQR